MTNPPLEIVRCPASLRSNALALVLGELAPNQRRDVAALPLNRDKFEYLAQEPLFVALRGNVLCGAAWAQRQPGNVAVFWPPQLSPGEDEKVAADLAKAVVHDLDRTDVSLAQSLLVSPSANTIDVLQHVGFRHLADLIYLSCETARFPQIAPACDVVFEEYTDSEFDRLTNLIERTYDESLDCTALDGARNMNDVVNGYKATGVYRPENWLFVRDGDFDVGVLLLADHPAARHWELIYLGLTPEVRGRGWGRQIAQYAQWLAWGGQAERLLVAVDAANTPAVAVYRDTGFEIWELRAVYLRFSDNSRA